MNLAGATVSERYTIEREIGRGGMATVWLANDRQHARRVAIKTLHPDLANAIGTDRFLREIRLTADLQHPGIVPILDSGTVDREGVRIPWYAMPYLEGESLRQRLDRETQLPIDEALRIATAVGQALGAAHARNVVHRDIKPENVFLAGDHVYVVDFGVAKAIAGSDADRLTSTGLAIGTPAYMSPEQAIASTVDARSDQYSLAVLLYEMLAGEPPFAGPNQQAVIARRLAEPARPLSPVRSTVPPAMERATLRALERTPADRFPSVTTFIKALSDGDTLPRVASTRTGARPSVITAVTVAIVSLVALAAWSILKPRGTSPEVIALYQRGVQEYDRRTQPGVVEAISLLGNALAKDSSYAPAWNVLAKSYARAYQRGFTVPEVSRDQLLPRAVAAIRRSTDLDPRNADAWATQGIISQQVNPADMRTALASIEKSLAIDSNLATTWQMYGVMIANLDSLSRALDAWRTSVRLNPAFTEGLSFLALGHYWRGDFDSAAVWADSAIRVDQNYLLGRHTAALIAVERGEFAVAEDEAMAAKRLADDTDVEEINAHAALIMAKARARNVNLIRVDILLAEVALGAVATIPPHTVVYMAQAYAAVGDVEKSLAMLRRYDTPRDMHFQLHLRCDPTFAPVENDPRFRALLVIPRPARGSHC